MALALAPGVYTIHCVLGTGDQAISRYVTDPNSDNEALTLTTGQANETRCLWLISGDGVIRSLDHDKKFASARLAPKTSAILRSSASLKWIINVTGTTGTIRADDGTRRFWGPLDNNLTVHLIDVAPANAQRWIFTANTTN